MAPLCLFRVIFFFFYISLLSLDGPTSHGKIGDLGCHKNAVRLHLKITHTLFILTKWLEASTGVTGYAVSCLAALLAVIMTPPSPPLYPPPPDVKVS